MTNTVDKYGPVVSSKARWLVIGPGNLNRHEKRRLSSNRRRFVRSGLVTALVRWAQAMGRFVRRCNGV